MCAADPHQRRASRASTAAAASRRARWTATNAAPMPGLGDHGAPRRARRGPSRSRRRTALEDHVHRVRDDEDHQRRAQVADPAQVALPGGREHERTGAPSAAMRRYSDGAVRHLALAAHQRHERRASGTTQREQPTPMASASHSACDADERGLLLAPRAVQARDLRGRAVGEEVEDRERRREHGRGDRERRELRRPEVPDDRRVDEHVQRLGGQRAERRARRARRCAVVARARARHLT